MSKQYAMSFGEYLRTGGYQGPYSATDIVIRHHNGKKGGIVLIGRKNEPFGLALPGGKAERMRYDENAIKEGVEETGLQEIILDGPIDEQGIPYRPLCVYSGIDDDPRVHISSITYTGKGRGILKPDPKEDALFAEVYSLEEIVELLKHPKQWAMDRYRWILQNYLREVQTGAINPHDY